MEKLITDSEIKMEHIVNKLKEPWRTWTYSEVQWLYEKLIQVEREIPRLARSHNRRLAVTRSKP